MNVIPFKLSSGYIFAAFIRLFWNVCGDRGHFAEGTHADCSEGGSLQTLYKRLLATTKPFAVVSNQLR